MTDNGNARIVVGVDGTTASMAALRWAATEAERRGCFLDVVTVTDGSDTDRSVRIAAAAAFYPVVRMRAIRTVGAAAPSLVRAARGAAMLVVGSATSHGRLATALLGSVGAYCVAHAPCPVVVVPDPNRVTEFAGASDVDAQATPGPLL